MTRFEDLPSNVQALILAKLASEMRAQKTPTIYHLARLWDTDLTGAWRNICRKAGQSICTIPVEVMSAHRRELVRNP